MRDRWHSCDRVADAAGYGIQFSESDRDKYFDAAWNQVVIELDDPEPATVSQQVAVPARTAIARNCREPPWWQSLQAARC